MKMDVGTYLAGQPRNTRGGRTLPRLFERALDNLKWAREVRDVNRYPCRLYASSILYDGEQQIKMERLLTERERAEARSYAERAVRGETEDGGHDEKHL